MKFSDKSSLTNLLNCLSTIEYPRVRTLRHGILTASMSAGFTVVFMLFFQPFVLSQFPLPNLLEIALIIGVIVFCSVLFFYWFYIVKRSKKKWSIKENTIWSISLLLFITNAIVSIGYILLVTRYKDFIIFPEYFILKVLVNVFAIGIVVYSFMRTSDYVAYQIKKLQQITKESGLITLKGKNKNEIIKVNKKDLICISSVGHYLEIIHYNENKIITKSVIRNSIQNIRLELVPYNFCNCHRSHIVNPEYITKVEGDARKKILHLDVASLEIPVSRNKFKDLEEYIAVS